MRVKFVDDVNTAARLFLYMLSTKPTYVKEHWYVLPVERWQLAKISYTNPISCEIDVGNVVDAWGEAYAWALNTVKRLWRNIGGRGLMLLRKRFGELHREVLVYVVPFGTKEYLSTSMDLDGKHVIALGVRYGDKNGNIAVLFHELAHAIVGNNPRYVELRRALGKEGIEALISFFWPGIDAYMLGFGIPLEEIEKDPKKLYSDEKVAEKVRELLPALKRFAESGKTVWEFFL